MASVVVFAVWFRFAYLPNVPPGLHHDEAFNGLDALRVLQGDRPIFFPANNGREPLFIYLQALAMALLGPDRLALRIVPALIGLLTVGATYFLGRRLFGGHVGWLAAALLAVSLWHVTLSRIGFRAILVPLFAALIVLTLWEGVRSGRRVLLITSGVLLGLSFYTYLAARLLPLVVFMILVGQALLDRRAWRWHLGALLLVASTAAVVAAPLGYYFWLHPADFLGRAAQVALPYEQGPPQELAGSLLESIRRTLEMFFVAGDTNWRHNLAGRSVFDPVTAIIFLVGLGWAVTRILQPVSSLLATNNSPRLFPRLWILVWATIMLLPSIFTLESPHFLRTLGAAPAIYLIAGFGVLPIAGVASRILQQWRLTPAVVIWGLSSIIVAWSGSLTYRDYFQIWANRPETYYAHDGNLYDAALALNVQQKEPTFLSSYLFIDGSPTIAFLSPRYSELRWFDEESTALPLPPQPSNGAVYRFSPQAALLHEEPDLIPQAQVRTQVNPDGKPVFMTYRVSASTLGEFLSSQHPLGVRFGDDLELLGYSVLSPNADAVPAGSSFQVALLWRVLRPGQGRFAFFAHLQDRQGWLWTQSPDRKVGMVLGWQEGDMVLSLHRLDIPVDAPPITYQLLVGAVSQESGRRLEPASPEAKGQALPLLAIQLAKPSAPQDLGQVEAAHRVGREVASGIELWGYDLSPERPKVGDHVNLLLRWLPHRTVDRDLRREVRLEGNGRTWTVASGPPADGAYPSMSWAPGFLWREIVGFDLPAELPSGDYRMVVALLDGGTGQQLGEVEIGSLSVTSRERQFTLPLTPLPLEAQFDGQVTLRGYDLSAKQVQPGQTLTPTLYWQAVQTPKANYTVFAHLLDASGRVVAQRDSQPLSGAAPMLGWLPGEIIVDPYPIVLPPGLSPGEYQLEVGIYDSATGRRLPVAGGGDSVLFGSIVVR